MPIKQYNSPPSGRVAVSFYCNDVSNINPLTGRVDISQQGLLNWRKGRLIYDKFAEFPFGTRVYADNAAQATSHDLPYLILSKIQDKLYAEARARFDGRLRSGHADLGVTLGSWKQSWDMIAKRGRQAAASLDRAHRRLSERLNNSQRLEAHRRISRRDKELRRWRGDNQGLETPANLVLEGEFGWLPLLSDAAKAFGVMTKPCPNGWVTGRTNTHYSHSVSDESGNPATRQTWDGRAKCSVVANVWVDNPNLWLANQLGLINLPGVAWDLVPWSFVVNMFTNLGQIANSFSSHYGLRMNNVSVTHSHSHVLDDYIRWTQANGPAVSKTVCTYKNREPGPLPGIPFVFRMPEVNLELGLIAVSLAIQQVSRITKLLR